MVAVLLCIVVLWLYKDNLTDVCEQFIYIRWGFVIGNFASSVR